MLSCNESTSSSALGSILEGSFYNDRIHRHQQKASDLLLRWVVVEQAAPLE